MDKNSTSIPQVAKPVKCGPKKSTVDFIRQFARIYMPIGNMPGIALN